jgi:hypothetical protein
VSPHRKRVVNLWVAIYLTGSAVAVITQRDFWPFSHYPMYAALQAPEKEVLEVVGVDTTGEIPLAPSRRTSIVAGMRYRATLDLLVEQATESDIRAYLASRARHYEHARSDDKPMLESVRLHKSRWRAVPADEPPARRIGRQLLAELKLDR